METILHSILSVDLLVVYGQSGIGKTSLLSAGVFQHLRDRGLWPVMLRLNDPQRRPFELIDEEIRAAADAAPGLELLHHPSGYDVPESLWDLLSALEVWNGNTLLQPVLVFDQFEELFTLEWGEIERVAFISELGEIVRRRRSPGREPSRSDPPLPPPDVKIVLSLRADALGELEALSTDIPQILRNRVRVLGLDDDQAGRAIREPAAAEDPRLRSVRFVYTPAAASMLLDFLRMGDERDETLPKARVDPSQLQVVCQHIERVILPLKAGGASGLVEITAGDLGGFDGLNEILRDFYRREVDSFDPEVRAKVKNLCETGLISRSGRRLSLEEGEIQAQFGVSREVLEALIDRRLLRAEPRVGSIYYELAHDTLVAPTMAYRRERQEREATEQEKNARAARFDRWSFRAGLANLFFFGVLGGFSMALPLMALRSPPRRREGRWKRGFALGVGLVYMLMYSFLPWPPDTFKFKILTFLLLVLQPALGAVIGLAWPISGATERPRRLTWAVALTTVILVGVGLAGVFLGDKLAEPSATAASLEPAVASAPSSTHDVGDCVEWLAPSLQAVSCDDPHPYEVYAIPGLGDAAEAYPGDEALTGRTYEACLAEFQPYVGLPNDSSIYDFSYVWPSELDWTEGERSGTCLVHLDSTIPVKEDSARNSVE